MHTPTPKPDAFLDSLDGMQTKAFNQLVERLRGPNRTLSDCRACGELIAALRPADAAYGAGWVKAICKALAQREVPISLTLAYRFVKFAEQFPGAKGEAQVRRLEGKTSWEVVMRVLHIEDAELLTAILQRAANEGLSSRAVIDLIREQTVYRRARGGRPKPKPSSHPNRALKDLRVLTTKWQAVYTSWAGEGNNALMRAAKLKPAKVTDAFVDDLKAVASLVEEMARAAGPLAKELAGLHRALSEKRGKQK
ncbi:MAG: hypothetical protein K8U57_02045 [Planctomycetes bacterium]|nr:hypothetical protein [Planctomycetota bacterium]